MWVYYFSLWGKTYIYKFIVAICMTPILYFVHKIIDAYLGKELAHKLTQEAQQQESH